MPKYTAGDLVWVSIGGGYGWWPCQVMEPHHTPEQRRAEVLRLKKPDYILVHCFGDDTFNWYHPLDVNPMNEHFTVRAAQKHKSPSIKKHFKLGLEQMLEIADVRAGRPPATAHKPVDFTRPETYEHLIAPPAAADDEQDGSGDADRLVYPAAAAAEDCAGVAAAAVLAWIKATAAEPAYMCQELSQITPAAAAGEVAAAAAAAAPSSPLYMSLLWSFIHTAAVDEHGVDKFSALSTRKRKRAKQQQHQQQQQGEQAELQDVAAAATAAAGRPAKKQEAAKRKSNAAAAGGAGEGHHQQQQPAKKRRKQQHQQQQQQEEEGPVLDLDPREHDEYLLKYGGPIPRASFRKAVQFLAAAAVNPEPILNRFTFGHAKAIAVFLRWREVEHEESRCRTHGELSSLVKNALIRAEAYPILAPDAPPAAAAAAATGGGGHGGVVGSAATAAGILADMRGIKSESGADESQESGDEKSEGRDGIGDRARKLPRSSRGLHEGEQSALAALTAAQAASREDRIKLQQEQYLAAAMHCGWYEQEESEDDDGDTLGIGRDEDSSSDWDGRGNKRQKQKRCTGSVTGSSGSAAAAAAAASGSSEIVVKEVAVKQYATRIPESSNAWMSEMQRWGAERSMELNLGKVCSHSLTTADAYKIFKLVAERGGFEATSERRAWAAIAREWHVELTYVAKNVSVALKKWYARHMLGYERHISFACPVVIKTFKDTPARGSGTRRRRQKQQQQQQRVPRERAAPVVKVKQEPLVEDDSSGDQDDDVDNVVLNNVKVEVDEPHEEEPHDHGRDDDDDNDDDDEHQDNEDEAVIGQAEEPKPTARKAIKPEQGERAAGPLQVPAAADGPRKRLPLPAAVTSPSSSKPQAAAAAAGDDKSSDDKFNEADRRLVKFTFRDGYRLPPFVTVMNAAKRFQHDVDKAMIRVYKHRPVASILFSSASIAAYAAEGFRKFGRKMLRVPDDELFEVELTWLPSRRMEAPRDSAAQASSRAAAAATATGADYHGASAAAGTGSGASGDTDKCLVKFTFSRGYQLPTIQTVQQAARRFQRDIDRANIRVFKREPNASILFNDAKTAATAAENFRQHGRQWFRMGKDDQLDVEVTWLINKAGEIVRARNTVTSPPQVARASDYFSTGGAAAADHQYRGQQQQQQHQHQQLFQGPPLLGGPRPMVSLTAAGGPVLQQQQQHFALPGGIVIVAGPPALGAPPAAAAPGLAPAPPLPPPPPPAPPGHGPIVSHGQLLQPLPLLLDPRRQQQYPPQQQLQPGPMVMVSGPPQQQHQQQHQQQQHQHQQQGPVPPPQPPPLPQAQTVLPIIDLAALANAIGASTLQLQPQQHQQQQQMPLQLPVHQQMQPPQLPVPPPQPPQLPIQQLQLPQLHSMPQQQHHQQQQQHLQPPAWNQAEFQAKLQDLLKDLGHSTRT